MKRFNIMAAKKYPKQDGSQGTKWVKLGMVTQKADGSFFGEIDSLPTGSWFDGTINLFPIEQQQGQGNRTTSSNMSSNQYGTNQGNGNNSFSPSTYGNYQG